MKKLFFVTITILLTISIDVCVSQFAAILQPKSIRNGAAYHQEVFYGGNNQPNVVQQQQAIQSIGKLNIPQSLNKPKLAPRDGIFDGLLRQGPIPVPTVVTTTTRRVEVFEDEEFENTPRPIVPGILRQGSIVRQPVAVTTQETTERVRSTTEELTSEELEHQAKSAHYEFGTSVRDTINDHEHTRQEIREGLALKGMYSYSDGFFRRTVHYEADEGGYRVTKEEIQPITGDGPKFNPRGQAEVKSTLAGDYSITVDDFRLNKQQEKILLNDEQ
ncbi:uncharacterized protein Cpr51A [Chironomus tepperi]|uniref:uncharacterized protein Cpr51A n=1 Tax=Chironomus tepperi TaxID=113505 RepID=UPI00391F0FA2